MPADLFGPPRPVHSLFFALMPDAQLRDALADMAARIEVANPLHATPAHRLHLTLYYIGESEGPRADWVAGAERAVERLLPVTPFAFELDRVAGFRGAPAPCVALVDPGHESALSAFRQRLHDACRREGLPEAGHARFTPHVTLGRVTPMLAAPIGIPPLRWQARTLALVHSVRGQSAYQTVGTWHLDADGPGP
ncbi:2'-5' RNA ligase family protein [Luteimonas deserti]|uniref:2'-5' RNA ligase family protein n=1 Tax=Luteimonas deserti TaxID=2752306 RepID=A0A7Z0QR22_9GAMM|nr:2'-5' RNA ligase family protein [Luteimonas deserti]NYZ63297.1 2'-5' RNA ligase family protein [Luteimonas deserti]